MISFAAAWVCVTAIKNRHYIDGVLLVIMFVITGLLDLLIVMMVLTSDFK